MAKLIEFPAINEWSRVDSTITARLKAEGLSDESIHEVLVRIHSFREEYLSFHCRMDIEGLSPEAYESLRESVRKLQQRIYDCFNRILLERISTEVALIESGH